MTTGLGRITGYPGTSNYSFWSLNSTSDRPDPGHFQELSKSQKKQKVYLNSFPIQKLIQKDIYIYTIHIINIYIYTYYKYIYIIHIIYIHFLYGVPFHSIFSLLKPPGSQMSTPTRRWWYHPAKLRSSHGMGQNPGTPVVHIKIAGIYGCE